MVKVADLLEEHSRLIEELRIQDEFINSDEFFHLSLAQKALLVNKVVCMEKYIKSIEELIKSFKEPSLEQ